MPYFTYLLYMFSLSSVLRDPGDDVIELNIYCPTIAAEIDVHGIVPVLFILSFQLAVMVEAVHRGSSVARMHKQ